jgi:hypothetical protein
MILGWEEDKPITVVTENTIKLLMRAVHISNELTIPAAVAGAFKSIPTLNRAISAVACVVSIHVIILSHTKCGTVSSIVV